MSHLEDLSRKQKIIETYNKLCLSVFLFFLYVLRYIHVFKSKRLKNRPLSVYLRKNLVNSDSYIFPYTEKH